MTDTNTPSNHAERDAIEGRPESGEVVAESRSKLQAFKENIAGYWTTLRTIGEIADTFRRVYPYVPDGLVGVEMQRGMTSIVIDEEILESIDNAAVMPTRFTMNPGLLLGSMRRVGVREKLEPALQRYFPIKRNGKLCSEYMTPVEVAALATGISRDIYAFSESGEGKDLLWQGRQIRDATRMGFKLVMFMH